MGCHCQLCCRSQTHTLPHVAAVVAAPVAATAADAAAAGFEVVAIAEVDLAAVLHQAGCLCCCEDC